MRTSMKSALKYTLPAIALLAGTSTDAFAGAIRSVLTVTDGRVADATASYAVGSYIYVGPDATGNINGYIYVQSGSYLDGNSAVNQDSTVTTELRTTQAATMAQMNMISDRISEVNGGPAAAGTMGIGGNSGSGFKPYDVWGRAAYNRLDDSNRGGKWNADLLSFALGVDYKVSDRFMAGLALTFNTLDGKSTYNRGNIHDQSIGLAPYASYQVASNFSVDAMAGYSYVTKKRDRLTPDSTAAAPVTTNFSGPRVSSKPKSDRYFVGLFGNLKHAIGKVDLHSRFGVTHASDSQKSFSESQGLRYTSQKTQITQAHSRFEVGYNVTEKFKPYVFSTYAYDFSATKAAVPDGLAVVSSTDTSGAFYNVNRERGNSTYGGGLGASFVFSERFSGGVEGHYKQNKDFKDYGAALNVKYKF